MRFLLHNTIFCSFQKIVLAMHGNSIFVKNTQVQEQLKYTLIFITNSTVFLTFLT